MKICSECETCYKDDGQEVCSVCGSYFTILLKTAMLIRDPMAQPKMKQVYDENGCQAFFDERQGSTNP